MARSYQTAQPEFVQDIMYRPPWELAKEVLAKEQGDYDTAVSKANLFGDIDIEHMDTAIERENAARIQQQYAQRADELINQMQSGTADDWRKAIPTMTKMGRELAADYKTGDISQIEGSAKAYAKFLEDTKGIKDAATKEAAKKAYLDRFNLQQRGSLDKVFSADEVYDKKDLTGEFIKELEHMDTPDAKETLRQYRKNGYINTASMTTKQLTGLRDQFGEFVKAKGYEPYLQQQEQFNLGKYFDPETGKLMSVDDRRSSLSSMADYVQGAEYKQVDKDLKTDADQLYMMNLKRGWELQDAANAQKQLMLSGPTKEAIVTTQEQVDKLNERMYAGINVLANRLGVKSTRQDGRITPGDIEKKIKKLRSNPNLSKAARAQFDKDLVTLNTVRSQYVGNKTRAGYSVMANVYGPEVAEAAQKGYEAYAKDPRALLPLKGDIFLKGKMYADTSIDMVIKNPKKYGFTDAEAAKIKGDAETEGQDIKDMYVQGSAMPVIVGENPSDWDYNEIQNEYYLGDIPVRQQINFKKLGLEYNAGTKQYGVNKKK